MGSRFGKNIISFRTLGVLGVLLIMVASGRLPDPGSKASTSDATVHLLSSLRDAERTTGPQMHNMAAFGSPTCELFPIYQGDQAGFIDNQGELKIAPQFDDALEFSEGLAAVKVDGKWGYIDKTGKVTIRPQFEYAYTFSEGLAAVLVQGGLIYINRKGEQVIDRSFDRARPFSDGLALVYDNEARYLIDKTGKTNVLNNMVRVISGFSEGLAVIKLGSLEGYMDRNGKVVIEPKFEWTSPFSEGLALASFPGKPGSGYINKSGRPVIEPITARYQGPFSDGLAATITDKKSGYIDTKGRWVITTDAHVLRDFCNGIAYIVPTDKDPTEGIYINKMGKQVWPH